MIDDDDEEEELPTLAQMLSRDVKPRVGSSKDIKPQIDIKPKTEFKPKIKPKIKPEFKLKAKSEFKLKKKSSSSSPEKKKVKVDYSLPSVLPSTKVRLVINYESLRVADCSFPS